MRTIGLIGGMSWRTTALYYQEINERVASRLGGIHSANLLLHSLDYAQVASLISNNDFDGLKSLICQAGLGLKAAGAQGLVLCANVAHKTHGALESASGLPVLHVADFTGRAVMQSGFRKVGLLATRAVMEEAFYKDRLRTRFGLEVAVPGEEFRARADHDIFHEMSKASIPQEVTARWASAYEELVREHQVDCVVLACTELRLVFNEPRATPMFETTALHARGVADWALGDTGSLLENSYI